KANLQKQRTEYLKFGAWNFSGAWSLELGISFTIHAPIVSRRPAAFASPPASLCPHHPFHKRPASDRACPRSQKSCCAPTNLRASRALQASFPLPKVSSCPPRDRSPAFSSPLETSTDLYLRRGARHRSSEWRACRSPDRWSA